jgi:hypothetical protein
MSVLKDLTWTADGTENKVRFHRLRAEVDEERNWRQRLEQMQTARQKDLDDAIAEAQAMRRERDHEIAARVQAEAEKVQVVEAGRAVISCYQQHGSFGHSYRCQGGSEGGTCTCLFAHAWAAWEETSGATPHETAALTTAKREV